MSDNKKTISNYQLSISNVLKYFAFFNYSPTFEEIYTFLPIKTSKKALSEDIDKLSDRKKIVKIIVNRQLLIVNRGDKLKINTPYQYPLLTRYILSINNYQSAITNFLKKYQISKIKLNSFRFKLYIKLISIFSQIKLVGLSGSISMMNAGKNDDIDLFIITAKNRLFTGRFIALALAQMLGMRRFRHSREGGNLFNNKVCLNLFFDESNLEVPEFKKTKYVAHEVLQMKPLINKSKTYEKFLKVNEWVYEIFPNAKKDFRELIANSYESEHSCKFIYNSWKSLTDSIEKLTKNLQLHLIGKHKTNEIISDNQLWFHPVDFGSKLGGM